ncbi:MAG: hypothetical protein ACPGYV_12020, partial [Phycisphaeraceae bacterium]
MPEIHNRIALDRIDWASAFPIVRLASAFRYAMQPGKLVVAFAAIVLIHLSGVVLSSFFSDSSDAYDPG